MFRINFSHGRLEEYEDLLNKVRRCASAAGAHVAVLGDLPEPKIRLGEVEKEGFILEKGQVVEFVNEPVTASRGQGKVRFTTNYPALLDEVKPGERILIDDGSVSLVCREISGRGFKGGDTAEVTEGGRVASRKGVNLPDSVLSLPSLTKRDEQLVRFAVEKGFDYLALSFVPTATDSGAIAAEVAALEGLEAVRFLLDGYKRNNPFFLR